jgi:DNA-binding response OmpR family regulator
MEDWKALLVDDEIEFVSTLAERLRLRGIDALVATEGQEALAIVERECPLVVVLDIMMPGLGGLDILRALRERHPEVQVILLTGRGSTKEGMQGMSLGAFDFLLKPAKIEELIPRMVAASRKAKRDSNADGEG